MFKNSLKLVFVAVLVMFMADNAFAKEKVYKWKLAMTWGSNLPPITSTVYKFADRVEKMSNGRLVVRVDSSNKHKSAFGILDFVRSGQYEIGHTTSYYYKGKDINTLFFSTVPFGLTTPEHLSWFYYGGGLELMHRVYAKYGILAYPGGGTGNQMGGWFKKEMKSIDDFKGLKMRIPGFAGEVLSKVGAIPTNIPSGELYTALERGTIDALEWSGPSMDIYMGFHKIAKYYYTGWHEPGSELTFFVNEKAMKKLPKDLQEIVVAAMKISSYDMYSENMHLSGVAWENMKKDYPNIEVRSFPKSVIEKLKSANEELLDNLYKTAKDPITREIIDSKREYLKKIRAWTKMSDQMYLNTVAD